MATKTTNYNLVKPTYDEDADIVIINKNMDIIDAKMKEIEDAGGGSTITIDSDLSTTSENPVQNKVITNKISELNNNLDQLEIDLKMLGYTVPKECPIQNYVDSDGVFHQRVGRVDLGSLNWSINNNVFMTSVSTKKEGLDNFSCYKYKYYNAISISEMDNKEIKGHRNGNYIYIRDDGYTDANVFKNSLQGEYLYYELATEKTISVGSEAVVALKSDLGGLSFSANGTTLTITDGTNTWTLSQ